MRAPVSIALWDNSSPSPCYGDRCWCESNRGSHSFPFLCSSTVEQRAHNPSIVVQLHAEGLSFVPSSLEPVDQRRRHGCVQKVSARRWSTGSEPQLSLCSSKAEQPVDNRQTGVRYPAEGPIFKTLDSVGSLHVSLKRRRFWCDTRSSGHFIASLV